MRDKKRILIVGAFGFTTNQLDGQTVKTRNIKDLIIKNGDFQVYQFDTLEVKRNPLGLFLFLWRLMQCHTLILIPCLNNLTYIFPVVFYLSKIFRYEIIHICIGGWQIEYFKGNKQFRSHRLQCNLTKKIKAILPEMMDVDQKLKEELNFKNSEYFPNFRFFETNTKHKEQCSNDFRLVFMARINKKKGYPTVFKFAESARNLHLNLTIDFYGPIEHEDKEDFLKQLERHKDIVTYKGILQPQNIQSVLNEYDLMLFPTTYYTEGFPGTVLDAYIAGLPVIATNWKYAQEFIDNGLTGYIVPFEHCQDEFDKRIIELYNDRDKLRRMKNAAQHKSLLYSANTAWSVLSKYL